MFIKKMCLWSGLICYISFSVAMDDQKEFRNQISKTEAEIARISLYVSTMSLDAKMQLVDQELKNNIRLCRSKSQEQRWCEMPITMDDERDREICNRISKTKEKWLTPSVLTMSLDKKDVMTSLGEKMCLARQDIKNNIYHKYALCCYSDIGGTIVKWQEQRRRIMEGIYAGVDPDTCPFGETATALWHATRNNDIPLIEKLLAYKADPSKEINRDILLYAQNIEAATLLVNKGASLQLSEGLLHTVISKHYNALLIGYYASLGISKDSLSKYYNYLSDTFMTPIEVLIEKKFIDLKLSTDDFITYLEALKNIGVTQENAERACATFEARNKDIWYLYEDQMSAVKVT